MKTNDLMELMGSAATMAEAEAMETILAERGLSADEMTDEEFFSLIPLAIERAA